VEKLVEQRKQIGHARVFSARSYTAAIAPYCRIGRFL
jgi:hypothetical protein